LEELINAFSKVSLNEIKKQEKFARELKEEYKLREDGKGLEKISNNNEEENKVKESKFKKVFKRVITPLLLILGLSTPLKMLDSAENKTKDFQQPMPPTASDKLPEDFRSWITYTPPDGEIKPTATYYPANAKTVKTKSEDKLVPLKTKMHNDEKLNSVITHALSDFAIDGKYDFSNEEKLDFIMQQIDNKNFDCILDSRMNRHGYKDKIINLIKDVVLYNIEKQTGEKGIILSYHKGTLDFSLKNENNTRFIATNYSKIAHTEDSYVGNNCEVLPKVAYILKSAETLDKTVIKNENEYSKEQIEKLGNLLVSLNTVGDEKIIVSRTRSNDMER